MSFSDAVVVATVASEKKVTDTQDDLDSDELMVGRSITLTVNSILWVNTKLPDYNPSVPVPSQLTVGAAGWSSLQGVEYEMALQDSSRLETGNTYVIPLTKYRTGEGWGLTSASGVLPYNGGVIGQGEHQGVANVTLQATDVEFSPLAVSLLGKSATAMTTALSSATPHTGVSQVDTPDDRLAAYNAATYPSDPAEEEPEPDADFPPISDPGVD
ncbi:hypothetical protein AB0L71_29740 [Streptomyces sp. NPDC052052]|uniref:hypothetical protein n=1 Tax=Streptomyces sp. NPDC052052 TaxID=3154756 RepID=UPI003434EB7F